MDDDSESVITNRRYSYISSAVTKAVRKKAVKGSLSVSDKIDQVVTNRILALPIFVAVMFLVYAVAMGGWRISIGIAATDWANNGLFGEGWFLPFSGSDIDSYGKAASTFEEADIIVETYESGETLAYLYDDETGETSELEIDEAVYAEALTVTKPDPTEYGIWIPGIPVLIGNLLKTMNVNEVLFNLILDGIVGGVGAVLGFVPQMLVLFLLLTILEDVGYMARIAFIVDRIFRRFGLSGKSFIPMLVATGCGVPGIMDSRTI